MSQPAEVLTLSGPQTVREVAETHRRVVDHIGANDPARIDVTAAGPVDALAVQLLLSALMFAREHGRTVAVEIGEETAFLDAMRRLGLIGDRAGVAVIDDGIWVGLQEQKGS